VDRKYIVKKFSEIPVERSSCGYRRKLLGYEEGEVASVHLVDISEAKRHYHKKTTEFYFIVKGSGEMELDGETIHVEEGDLIVIKPGCRHRAVGNMRALIIGIPPFTEEDMYYD